MNQNNQHENLARLGEELLKVFETAEQVAIPADFDGRWRQTLGRKKRSALQFVRCSVKAAVLAFALVGVLTVAALSIDSLRTPLLKYAALHFAEEEEIRLEEPEEIPEYHQISYLYTDNIGVAVYSDDNDNYQLLWSNELGQRLYSFHAPEMDEEFFRDLGEQFMSAEE